MEKIVFLDGFKSAYKPRNINMVLSADHNGMAAHLTRSVCEGSNAVDRTDENMFWNDSEEDRHVSSWCDEDEGTDIEDGYSATDW